MASCTVCQDLQSPFLHTLPPGRPAAIFTSIASITDAIQDTGCASCSLIKEGLDLFRASDALVEPSYLIELRIERGKSLKLNEKSSGLYLELFTTASKV
jgi:hypothetical protein